MFAESIVELAADLGVLLHSQQRRIATAESCTGGYIAEALTQIPGSSAWFDRGFVTYSNEAKQDMLGVSEIILTNFGAVSRETVLAMVAGALTHSHADYAIAVSGIAGPGGGSAEKPVGLIWFALGDRTDQRWSQSHIWIPPKTPSDSDISRRQWIREQAVIFALNALRDFVANAQFALPK